MTTDSIRDKITAIRRETRAAYQEGGQIADGLILAILTGAPILLVGPPGTAKSARARTVADAITDARSFKVQVGRAQPPSKVLGPPDLTALKAGDYRHKVDGYLPTAHVAMIDEVFRASPALTDDLLKIMAERKVDFGAEEIDCPTRLLVGTTNTVPEGDGDQAAFFDRWILRYHVGHLRKQKSWVRMLSNAAESGPTPAIATTLTLSEIDAARDEVEAVKVSEQLVERFVDILLALKAEGFEVSERTAVQALALIRARAYLAGRTEADTADLDVIADVAWDRPEDRSAVYRVVLNAGSPKLAKAIEAGDLAEQLAENLPRLSESNMSTINTACTRAIKEIDGYLTDCSKLASDAPAGEAEKIARVITRIKAARERAARLANQAIERG